MTDTRIWLEDVQGTEALEWVRARNAEKAALLAQTPEFRADHERVTAILDSPDQIPSVTKIGPFYYNFWTDAQHERGLWRRTTLDSYRTADPSWETVLDLDALSEAEGENWVWHGAEVLPGQDQEYRLALVNLSRGGADADVRREFDLHTGEFVVGGYSLPEAKSRTSWIDEDTLFVCTDTGAGSMTSSGYPRVARRWRRGTALTEAEVVFAGEHSDMQVTATHDDTPGFERDLIKRDLTFHTHEHYLLTESGPRRIEVPGSARVQFHRQWLLVRLRHDWNPDGTPYSAGSLLAIELERFLSGSRAFQVLYVPTTSSSLAAITCTRRHLVLRILDDVRNRLEVHTPADDGEFTVSGFPGVPEVGTVQVWAVDPREGDDVWITTTDFTAPTTLWRATVGQEPEQLKAMPEHFDAAGLVTEQHFATSEDGTRVPYFVVRPESLPFDGRAPTVLFAYGGFEVAHTPTYTPALGATWLERGGVYALANIRGGGEYGPQWHQAALREKRHRAHEDLAAVARDLVNRGVTSPSRLGVRGGSNGGLLVGNMLTRYPELFGAIVCLVPLLDMKRYSHLLAGASWIAEYGDPDEPEQWESLRNLSPYHLFDPAADYPPILFVTSTRDDRVHPGHARKMADMMIAAGKDVTYYENIEGGHGGSATNAQAAHMAVLNYHFLAQRLGLR